MKIAKLNKQRLILVSDLWGIEKAEWLIYYTSILTQYFDVKFYDSCELGNIDKSEYVEDDLHQQFLNGGVDKAVENIVQNENELIDVIGFSIGGYIAWKACDAGLNIRNLYAISSTRLRNETKKPITNIQLFYGENDPFKPTSDWFKQLDIKENLFLSEGHDLYKENYNAEEICKIIIQNLI